VGRGGGIGSMSGECEHAVIELAPREEATEAEETWAKAEIARYGSDRVAFDYSQIGVAT
jgi:hypothetical protein